MDPLLRKISLALEPHDCDFVRSTVVRHFAAAVELMIPSLVDPDQVPGDGRQREPLVGRLASPVARSEARRAADLLLTRMDERWTVELLAAEVSLSASHLPRVFRDAFGSSPIRYLNEIRVTAFARLLEETDLAIAMAARRVGWQDSRVAATWFRRRYGMSPSVYRRDAQAGLDEPPVPAPRISRGCRCVETSE